MSVGRFDSSRDGSRPDGRVHQGLLLSPVRSDSAQGLICPCAGQARFRIISRNLEEDISIHIFSTSATMVGVCLTVIGIFKLLFQFKPIETIGDDLPPLFANTYCRQVAHKSGITMANDAARRKSSRLWARRLKEEI